MTSKKTTTSPPPVDPLLQGTYWPEDDEGNRTTDVRDELAAFERRLSTGEPTHSPSKNGKAISAATGGGKRYKAAAPHHGTAPATTAGAKGAPLQRLSGAPADHAAVAKVAQRRMSEEEQEVADGRQNDIDDVRHLGKNDPVSDSD